MMLLLSILCIAPAADALVPRPLRKRLGATAAAGACIGLMPAAPACAAPFTITQGSVAPAPTKLISSQAALYRDAMAGDAAARVRANEAVFEQAWGTISTMAYDPLAGVRFDGRFNAREWTARKKTAFSVDARRFETPAGTRAEIETLLDAIDDRWAAYDPPPAERPPRVSSPLDDVAVARAADAFGALEVVAVRPGSAAERADIRVGDLITDVNGRPTKRMRAPVGARKRAAPLAAYAQSPRSTLDLRRGTTRFRASLAPGVRPARDVTTARLGDDARYVRIAAFERGTAAKLAALLLERDAPPVLVLDLRNNNGGELQEALRASALFFDDAYFLPPARASRAAPFHPPRGGGAEDMTPLCFTANSRGEYTDHDVEEFRTDRLYPRAPVGAAARPPTRVVLVANRGTASAAEAFASALRDNGVAALVGEQTFGKALVQHAFPLPDGGALRLTVAELLSPRQKHLAPATLADLRDPAAARGGLAPDHSLGRVCAPGPASDVGEDSCVLAALDAARS